MKTDALLATELVEVIEKRKSLEKRESELKDLFKLKMGNLGIDTLSISGVLISLIAKTRTSLNRKSLVAAMGEVVVSQFDRTTEYTQVDVKIEKSGSLTKVA